MKKPLKILCYILGAFLSVGIIALMVYQTRDSFVKIWQGVSTRYLFLSLLSSVLIYISMGLSLYEVLRIMGRRVSKGAAIGIALVSTTVNYVVSSLGVSGFALRAHLLNRRRVPFGMCVTASIVITVLLYFVLAVIILQGSVLMLFNSSATTMQILKNFSLIVVMCAVCAVITAFLFNNEWRSRWLRKIFRMINKVLYHVFRALIAKNKYDSFMDQLDEGIDLIHKKKKKLTMTIVYVCADWLFTILVLYFAFRAVGVHITAGVLVAGFAVGMVTTLIPILPGGLGAMELAMTAVYSQMGIDWDSALMAALIYRVVYYVIPGIISIFIYWGLQLSSPSSPRKKKLPKEFSHERTY
ncbi:lysylphosphatidylglycerol synthase transmembrane domain-containing protein [Candidatus Avelusimicrobium gallicola]|uniref:lysylphosphatidylglycerol synthase transmembrane domain-containing protein n=1 Tax=Candidatus Avelusimicrobium gallicola TaxID=2562704 RepID=UPI0013025BC4|nr:lysylphosphatidylglycerol synthase transmembrane domain-containing protein [Elusimicrobium sp. An273]